MLIEVENRLKIQLDVKVEEQLEYCAITKTHAQSQTSLLDF